MKWIPMAVAVLLAAFLGRELFPKHVREPTPPPRIETIHDTVRTVVRLQGPKVVTTDTIQLVVHETLHDTVQINVNADSMTRMDAWPILNAEIGKSRGDTSRTTTFSLRSGKIMRAAIWTPGPLKSIWTDSVGTPRMDFYDPPKANSITVWTVMKWATASLGAGYLLGRIF